MARRVLEEIYCTNSLPYMKKKKRTKRKEQITIRLNSLLSQLKITLGGFKSHVECQETETCLAEEDKELFFPLPF